MHLRPYRCLTSVRHSVLFQSPVPSLKCCCRKMYSAWRKYGIVSYFLRLPWLYQWKPHIRSDIRAYCAAALTVILTGSAAALSGSDDTQSFHDCLHRLPIKVLPMSASVPHFLPSGCSAFHFEQYFSFLPDCSPALKFLRIYGYYWIPFPAVPAPVPDSYFHNAQPASDTVPPQKTFP